MFISIDHISDMQMYTRKEYPTQSTMINLSHIVQIVPHIIYPHDERTEITKVTMSNHQCIYLPFTIDETLAMIRKATKVSDFRVAIGDYYVEIKKYITPSDIDKAQLAELGR